MLKVGIITLCDLDNYGNRLQAYAVSETLKSLNCKPVHVQYCKGIKSFTNKLFNTNKVARTAFYWYYGLLKHNSIGSILRKCNRLKLFSSFSKSIKHIIISSDRSCFDYYICGSDQIWNPDFAGDSFYFAEFAEKRKRVSYSASFGVSSLPENVKKRYNQHLCDMAHISVREQAGADIIKEISGKNAQVLVDPTFMLDRSKWHEIAKKPDFQVPGKYILTYFLADTSDETNSYIEKLAKENDLHIISLSNIRKNKYWYASGPAEFIWMIENASLVCTDSFHASVFSVLMDSPFIVFKRMDSKATMHSRIATLLQTLRLTDRFYDCLSQGEEFSKNYSHIPQIIEFEKEKSYAFLKNALNLTAGEIKND